MSTLDRAYAWSRRHPLIVDLITALPWTLVSALALPMEKLDSTQWIVWVVMLMTLQVALALRTIRVHATLGMLAVLCVVHVLALGSFTFLAVSATMWAAHLAHARTDDRVRRLVTVALLAGTVWASIDYERDIVGLPWWERYVVVIPSWFAIGFFCLLGTVTRKRREETAAAISRAELVSRQQAQEQRLTELDERTHIARELHDVVAHSLGVIIAQADGGRYAAATDPAAATQALTRIGEVGRSSLSEMRTLLTVLRADDARGRTPAPSVVELDSLLEDYRRVGLDVQLTVSGEPRELTPTASLTVFRIVQESLTNALKHGGTPTHVSITWGDERTSIVCRNALPEAACPAPNSFGAGHGLIGMRERVAMMGGTFAAGPQGPEWVVAVELPLIPGSPAAPTSKESA